MSSNRAELIENVLIQHQKHREGSDLVCHCGHTYRLGESIQQHRAQVVDAALTLDDLDVPRDGIPEAALGVLDLAGARRLRTA